MPACWNDEITCKFVELYIRSTNACGTCIVMSTETKNARQTALEKIVENIGWENFTTEDPKQKIKVYERPTNKNLIKLTNLRDPSFFSLPISSSRISASCAGNNLNTFLIILSHFFGPLW
jgi:hypothetical protein